MAIDVISLIFVFGIIISIDLNSLLNSQNAKKNMIVYFTILIFGFAISLLQTIDKAPASPTIYIEKAIDSILSR